MLTRDIVIASLTLSLVLASPGHRPQLAAQGQTPGTTEQPGATPVFRSGAEAIQVDVTVTDKNGRLITDLTAEDFEIFENGAPQDITTFANIARPSATGSDDFDGVESDVASNMGTNGRTYVIAIDTLRPEIALRARQLMKSFIDDHLGPNDIAAVVPIGQSQRTARQDFTNSKARLHDALDRTAVEAPLDGITAPEAWGTNAAINQIGAMADLIEFTLKLPPGRKALLLVAEGLGMDVDAVLHSSSRAKTLKAFCIQTEVTRAMSCEPSQMLHRALVAAARSNLVIYPIDPAGLTGSMRNYNFVDLASVTGGFAIDNTNTFKEHFARIAEQNDNYYLLGFNSAYKGQVGRSVPIKVTVRRPGAKVQARSNYVSPFPEEKVVIAEATRPQVASALRSPVSSGELPIQVTAAPFKGPDGNSRVALAIQLDASRVSMSERRGVVQGRLEVLTAQTLQGGGAMDGQRWELKFDMKPATRAKLQATGIRVLAPLTASKGRYQLRVAAGNDNLAGGVVFDLDVPDFDKRFVMSGLLVGSEQSDAILTVNPSNTGMIPGVTSVVPTTRRDFSQQDVLRIYTELYDDKASPADFAGHAELRDGTGKVVLSKPLERVPGEHGLLEGFRMWVTLPLAGVTAGTYALQVHGRSGDDKDRRGTRSLLVRVK